MSRAIGHKRAKKNHCAECGAVCIKRLCDTHAEKNRAYSNAHRAKRIASGTCLRCTDAVAPGRRHCPAHVIDNRKCSQIRRLNRNGGAPKRGKVVAFGRAWSLKELAAHMGVQHSTLWQRIMRRGLTIAEAIERPVQRWGEDLTGRVFERLTVVKRDGLTKAGKKIYACRCSCGRPDLVRAVGADLKSGRQRSCGCIRREKSSARSAARREDITGQVFAEGKVVVLGLSTQRRKSHGPYSIALWDCRCHCGTVFQATTSSLKLGQVSSCGCRKRRTVMLFGAPVTLTEMAKLTGLSVQAIHYRLRVMGMTPEEAISATRPRKRA